MLSGRLRGWREFDFVSHCRAALETPPQHLQPSRNRVGEIGGNRCASDGLRLRRFLQFKPLAMVVAAEFAVDETAGRRERNIAVAAPHEV